MELAFSTDASLLMGLMKVSRNAPCPCGSGRKYKICCGSRAAPDPASTVEARYAVAAASHGKGLLAEAEAGYRGVLAERPRHPGALHGLGLVRYQLGAKSEGRDLLRLALDIGGDNPELYNNLGTIERDLGALEQAIVCHHRAIRLRPEYAEAHNNLGNALAEYGRLPEAELAFRQALGFNPRYPEAHLNFGNVLRRLGRPEEALDQYRLALEERPDFADAYNGLGTLYKDLGRWHESIAAYDHALALAPDWAVAIYNRANVLNEIGMSEEAAAGIRRAIELAPDFAEAHLNLGNMLKDQGRLEDAMACYARALEGKPGNLGAESNLLFTLAFVDGVSQQEVYERHRAFNARHGVPLAEFIQPHQNTPDPGRRLKIGYISPDLRAHACAFFLEPLLAHHDRNAVEVYAYAEVKKPDETTLRLSRLCDHWRSTVGANDEAVAAQIRADGIDILVDLAGHTANSRLLVLARKPAPIQLGYLGYPATTGLDTVDYRLTDARTEPPGTSERWYTEELVRLPNTLWCYQPFDDVPEVSALPALSNGCITFGSFNNFAKIGPRVIALWADVLKAVPGSRLLMICAPAGETQARIRDAFARLEVDPSRLILHGRVPRPAYLQIFALADIALDPFPCNGGTTTCDALWMGLPVIALIGETFLSRASYSVLHAAGLTEYAANDVAGYVALAARTAADPQALAARRASMRAQLRESPLMRADLFARDVETVYRQLWQRWCARTTAEAMQ
ncbi:MAG: tetratricopeptide repeat protein [Gammaproteobacteria bacterium]|nr:tetratricopeptide repeat protein [Gammaproteobacteria bacterium]